MYKKNNSISLSASDLIGFLGCHHLTNLDLSVIQGKLEKPNREDRYLELLQKRGDQHETNYVEFLADQGLHIETIQNPKLDDASYQQTIALMEQGVDVIVQAVLMDGVWGGYADILKKSPTPSRFDSWSYEVIDTKLSRQTKGGTILQLCLYSNIISDIQEIIPEFMYVVSPGNNYAPEQFRTLDYSAYFRLIQNSLKNTVSTEQLEATYPDPKSHCDICKWESHCDNQRRQDDHLCLVAGISKQQIKELHNQSITTMKQLSEMPIPLSWKPDRGSAESFQKIREQARIQVEGREKKKHVFDILNQIPDFGLFCLPEPSEGDIYFDLEGDTFVGDGGLEYLFGYLFFKPEDDAVYQSNWSLTPEQEKQNFEAFIDFVMDRWNTYPDLHIFHYTSYEPSALKRLMGRYSTREEELDQMLRAALFIDLYPIVKHSVIASVESYSIKKMERFYNFVRKVKLYDANTALFNIESSLELSKSGELDQNDMSYVQNYNKDDCYSTFHLRNWLESIRSEIIKSGEEIPRPVAKSGDPSESVSEWAERVESLYKQITHEIPIEIESRTNEEHARWLLADTLDWHRREDKSSWWEYFHMCSLSSNELIDERNALSGLEFESAVGGTEKAPIHRYRFTSQDTDLRGGEDLKNVGGESLGNLDSISYEKKTIDIKKFSKTIDIHPTAVFSHLHISTDVLKESLFRVGEQVASDGFTSTGQNQTAINLLLRVPPCNTQDPLVLDNQTPLEAALQLCLNLDGDVLSIQGPPGTGKTYAGGRMICQLVKHGKTVGITANSHKVIRNLLDSAIEASSEFGIDLKCVQKTSDSGNNVSQITVVNNYPKFFKLLGTTCNIGAGTSWLWARDEAFQSVDVLFIDEAAQLSLANVLAITQAGCSLVLLGDPQQLDQPTQGCHPIGTDVSALQHIIGEHKTIQSNQGLFLGETWRLHPKICEFNSELFYENRLKSKSGLENQSIHSTSAYRGNGLFYIPVEHQGNHNSSTEEAEKVHHIVQEILQSKTTWTDMNNEEKPLRLEDILIISPYNAQVFELKGRMPEARIGTVDKFQGQEAPIVIYSMATSSPEDAPRGMEFLFSLNRLNVAVSRARCMSILMGDPSLFEPDCKTPHQIKLANAYCRYRELAQVIV